MRTEDRIYTELDKLNMMIEDCYAYLSKYGSKNTERIYETINKAMKLKALYLERLKKINLFPQEFRNRVSSVGDTLNYRILEMYGRLGGL